jgi:hypothetical protein
MRSKEPRRSSEDQRMTIDRGKKKTIAWTLALIAGLGAMAMASTVIATSPEISCASQPGGYRYCRTATASGVTLIAQLTNHACHKNDTWGFDTGGIWVSNGCSARFRFGAESEADAVKDQAAASNVGGLALGLMEPTMRPSPPSAPSIQASYPAEKRARESDAKQTAALGGPAGERVIVKCESLNLSRKICAVRTGPYVELLRKLGGAQCRFNVTWGYDPEGIWVDQGCRAEFAVY